MKKEAFFELAVKHIVGETSKEESIQLSIQIQTKSEYAALYNELETYWMQSEKYDKEFSPDIAKAFQKLVKGIQVKAESKKRIIGFTKAWKYAASAVLLIGLSSLFYLNFYSGNSYEQVYNSIESTKEIILPDSTKVYLNRESKLTLASDFNKQKRKVKLEGEAFFVVSKNAEKPFVVSTKLTKTKVLGTSFNLKEDEETTTINVISGKVSFSNKKHHLTLGKGDVALFSDNSNSLKKLESSNPNSCAWLTKKLIFNDTELNKVFETLSNTYNVEFSIDQNINAPSIRFAGQFDQQSLEDVLDILALTLNLQIDKTEEQKYMVKVIE